MCRPHVEKREGVPDRKALKDVLSKWNSAAKNSVECPMEVHGKRQEYIFKVPYLPVNWIVKDEIDEPIAHLIANATMIVMPLAFFAYWTNSHLAGLLYIAVCLPLFHGRIILCMHYAVHCKAFHQPFQTWACQVMPAFFGLPPGLYRAHHCLMHHGEGNVMRRDLSSTEPYQRDNFLHFLHYWMRFVVGIWVELPIYAFWKGETALGLQVSSCSGAYIALLSYLWQNHQVGLLWVFGVYMPINSFLLMFGNWSQHMFINPECPRSAYGYSYNILNSAENLKVLNDGFHVEHHLNSRKHWSKFPSSFQKKLDQYKAHDALLFHSIGVMDVGFMAFTGQLHKLESQYRLSDETTWPLRVPLKDRLRPLSLAVDYKGPT